MSNVASQWYVEQWKDGVTHHYQSKGFTLRNCTSPPVKMDGKKMYFLVAGIGTAEEDVQPGSTAIPYNNGREKVEVTTKKSRAFSEVYEDDLDQMTVDEMAVENKSSAMALGRVHDKTIITALEAGVTNPDVGAYTVTAGPAELLKMRATLMAQDVAVDEEYVFCAVDSVIWANLMTFKQFASSDYVGPSLPYLQAGLAKTWSGIHVFAVSDSLLPIANTTERKFYMWAKEAIGFGWVRNLTGNVAWDNRKDCWTHNMRMRIGSKVILPKGIVRGRSDYDLANITVTG